MSRVIYKYSLEVADEQIIELPKDAKILTIQNQEEHLKLWALVNNEEEEQEERVVKLLATGKPVENDMASFKYLDTITMCNGNLVWHIFINKK